MTHSILVRGAAALAFLCLPSAAQATTLTKTVKYGVATKIDHYTGWKDDCSFLDIRIDTVQRPAHGTLSPRIAPGRIGDAQIGKAGACYGKPTQVMEIYYKPARGYRGTDSFAVDMRTPTSAAVRYYYEITVE